MSIASHRCFLLAFTAGALLAATAPARAADADVSARAPDTGTLRQEWIGLELTPVSLATSPATNTNGYSFDPVQAGPGVNIRLLRHRWQYAYVIPFMVGAYASYDFGTILMHVQGEGGIIVPGTDRRLELGAGLGLAVLSIAYSHACDGRCVMGGAGLTASLAARFLFLNRPKFTAGVGVRAYIPLQSDEVLFGFGDRHSSVVMGGLEVGFGRP